MPTEEPQRIPVRVILTVGDFAELTTPDRGPRAPLRVQAADIARDAGLPVNELPGREFTASRAADGTLSRYELLDDPRL